MGYERIEEQVGEPTGLAWMRRHAGTGAGGNVHQTNEPG